MVKKTPKLKGILKNTRQNSLPRINVQDASKQHSLTSLKRVASLKLINLYKKEFYCRTIFLGISNSLTQCFLGAVNIMALEHYFMTKDSHVLLGTLGFHFFSVEATLCLSRVNPLTHRHRKICHVVLQICGGMCVFGFIMPMVNKEKKSYSPHAVFGYLASLLMLIALCLGPFAWYLDWKPMKMTHIFVGLLVLLLSSISFIIAITDSTFLEFSGVVVSTVLVCFVVFYTLYILITILLKCYFRLKARFK